MRHGNCFDQSKAALLKRESVDIVQLTLHSDYVYLHVYPHLYALSLSTSVSIYPSLNLLPLQSTYPHLSLPLSLSSSVSIYPSFSLLSLHSTYPYLSLPLSLSSSVSIYLNLLSLHLTSFSDTPWTQTQVGVGGYRNFFFRPKFSSTQKNFRPENIFLPPKIFFWLNKLIN